MQFPKLLYVFLKKIKEYHQPAFVGLGFTLRRHLPLRNQVEGGSAACARQERFHGVVVSTQDSESCDPSSNLGGTFALFELLRTLAGQNYGCDVFKYCL